MNDSEVDQAKVEIQGETRGKHAEKSGVDVMHILIAFATLMVPWCAWLTNKYMEVDKKIDQRGYQEQVTEANLQDWYENHFEDLCKLVGGDYNPPDRSCLAKSGKAVRYEPIRFEHLKKPE